MSSRSDRGKRARKLTGSSSGAAPQPPFDSHRFLGLEQQARFEKLVGRKIWPEKVFDLPHRGNFYQFLENIAERHWEALISPDTQINADLVREFYANAIPIEGRVYTYTSYVRGRGISFSRDAINNFLGRPSPRAAGEKCEYARKKAAKTWNMQEIADLLSFERRGFTLNPSGYIQKMDRKNMSQMAQLYTVFLLNNVMPRSHTSDLTIDMSCLLFWIMTGGEVDVAQIISEEIRIVASSGTKRGTKPSAQLGFPSLIMALCRNAGVEFPNVASMKSTSVVDTGYVHRHCSPKLGVQQHPQPQNMAPPAGGRYNEELACRYNWAYFDANRRSQAMIHDSLCKLYRHQVNPADVPSFPTNEDYEAHCAWPAERPFFREGDGEDEEEEGDGMEQDDEED